MPEAFPESWVSGWLQRGFRPVQTAQYVYQDVNGNDIVRKTRFALMGVVDGKDSGEKTYVVQHRTLQSVLLGSARWEPGIGHEGWGDDLLYRRVALEGAIDREEDIFLCEGEKDADAVVRAGWGSATSHYQGAAGARLGQMKVLSRAHRYIIVLIDRDVTGYQLAAYHIEMLKSLGVPGRDILCREPGVGDKKADISDHIAAGLGPEDTRRVTPSELARLIQKHGKLAAGGGRRWGYGYNAGDGEEWVVNSA